MLIKVTLTPADVQNILLKHIENVCGMRYSKGEMLAVQRVGESPPAFEATVEVVSEPRDCRD